MHLLQTLEEALKVPLLQIELNKVSLIAVNNIIKGLLSHLNCHLLHVNIINKIMRHLLNLSNINNIIKCHLLH
jgi:hypothetical protein